jgi:hypothetical protein
MCDEDTARQAQQQGYVRMIKYGRSVSYHSYATMEGRCIVIKHYQPPNAHAVSNAN